LVGCAPVLIGMPIINTARQGRPLFNAAALLRHGRVERYFHKNLLPTYDVFDEDRYFEPGGGLEVLDIAGRRCAISICEDVWNDRDFWQRPRYHDDPIEDTRILGADILLNLSASPFAVGKQRVREPMLANIARKQGATVVYVNQVGGNDALLSDGRSLVLAPDGRVVARARAFEPQVLVVDLDRVARESGPGSEGTTTLSPLIEPEPASPEEEVYRALVLGTRDYAYKCGFRSAHLGLSGGIDSALPAATPVNALGPPNRIGVLMPSPYSSSGSVDDSLDLARRLGIRTMPLPITPLMQ